VRFLPVDSVCLFIGGCAATPLNKPEWGRYTQVGSKLYAHILERGIGPVNLEGMAGKVKSAHFLGDGSEINTSVPWNAKDNTKDLFLNLSSYRLPDEIDTVVELELV